MRVDLGAADRVDPGFDLYVDLTPNPNVPRGKMLVADLSEPWPFPTGSVGVFRAHNIIEHLPNKIRTMNEAWRSLRPGGDFDIIVPITSGVGAWCDPTHVSFWNRTSFIYFTLGTPERTRFGSSYGIEAEFEVVSEKVSSYERTFSSVTERVDRLEIVLRAVK